MEKVYVYVFFPSLKRTPYTFITCSEVMFKGYLKYKRYPHIFSPKCYWESEDWRKSFLNVSSEQKKAFGANDFCTGGRGCVDDYWRFYAHGSCWTDVYAWLTFRILPPSYRVHVSHANSQIRVLKRILTHTSTSSRSAFRWILELGMYALWREEIRRVTFGLGH